MKGFDDGRFLAPPGFLDRDELSGFEVSSHLKGVGFLLGSLGGLSFLPSLLTSEAYP